MSVDTSQQTTVKNPPLAGPKEERASYFFRWLGGHLVVVVRLVLACILLVCVVLPITSMFVEKLGGGAFDSLISGLPLSETRSVTEPSTAGDEGIPIGVQQNQSATGGHRERVERETISAAPRVTAYAVQIAGLLAALAGTLWAIVALSRVE